MRLVANWRSVIVYGWNIRLIALAALLTGADGDLKVKNSVATALAGTTGTDAKVTAGVDANGVIYVENRLGSAQNISVNVMAV